MTDEEVVIKLTHLHIKNALGKMSPKAYKTAVTQLGKKQKYSRHLGMRATEVSRIAVDIVEDYQTVNYLAVKFYTDLLIIGDNELHTVKLGFTPVAVTDDAELRQVTQLSWSRYAGLIDLYDIDTITMSIIDVTNRSTETIKLSIDDFIKGDY